MTTNVCPFNVSCEGPSNWESNSDITGSGVLIGFVGTAYIVFFLILVHYFVAYDPEDPPPRRDIPAARLVRSTVQRALAGTGNATNTSFDSTYWVPNPIDVRFLEWIRLTTKYLLETCRITLPSVAVTPTAFFNWAAGEKKPSEEGLDSWTPAICFFHLKCALHLYHEMRAQTGVPPFTQTPAFVEMLMSQSFIVVGFVIFWLWVILLWGTSKLTIAILNERWDANEKGDDSQTTQWQFGQVLPVLLLAAPLTTFFGPSL
ncbi:hypothetical protein CSPX01_05378 [Colletotrichum filicis]|nr:hypothetical protein CSPX01_05378 [Colletotrichum filicis]